MRITPAEHQAIIEIAHAVFGEDAVIRLFGSRADDAARGGDIDLHVEAGRERASTESEIQFLARFCRVMGERKVDLVVQRRGDPERAIDRIARQSGVVL